MLTESLTALAAAGGAAVVQAAGTDAWAGFRSTIAAWFGRGNTQREQAEIERLDRSAAALETAGEERLERERIRQEAAWEALFAAFLEDLNDTEQEQAADGLRALLARQDHAGAPTGPGGVTGGRDVNIRADRGAIASGVIEGGARIVNPPQPGPFSS
ncbi:hypothetical protein ACFWDI_26275 [Streptomyces sp. NPDC060064]|uniref:hypothetical protein n=1 Tax=Streptomyces sp. NPDC060064 TaxID=3347049 RepID=UPI0036D07A57